jgi:hypothetical protein
MEVIMNFSSILYCPVRNPFLEVFVSVFLSSALLPFAECNILSRVGGTRDENNGF